MNKKHEISSELKTATQQKLDQDWKHLETLIVALGLVSHAATDANELRKMIKAVPETLTLISTVFSLVAAQAIMNKEKREKNGE